MKKRPELKEAAEYGDMKRNAPTAMPCGKADRRQKGYYRNENGEAKTKKESAML
jgi:hypothetical protein